MRILREISWNTGKLQKPLTLIVVSDLHNEAYDDILPMLQGADALLVPGDISNRYRQKYEQGLAFLRDASKLLPTFLSIGNHELKQKQLEPLLNELRQTGAVLLCNEWTRFGEIVIGGWYDEDEGYEPYNRLCRQAVQSAPETMLQQDCAKIMLCHKPEHFAAHLADLPIDLTIAGHAHGGQIIIKGHGIYAPGQGLFPKLITGSPMKGLLVSAGAGNPCKMPRWGNPCEVLKIRLT